MKLTLIQEPIMKLFLATFVLLVTIVWSQNPLATQNPLSVQPTNPLTSASQVGVPIAFKQTYEAGVRLVSSSAGFSLTVPAGNIATYTTTETGQTGLVIQDQQSSGFIVLGFSNMAMNVFLQTDFLGLANVELVPVGTPQETADMVRARFQMDANGTPLALHIAARQGVAGNLVVMVGFALVGQDAGLSQALDSTMASLEFTQPASQPALSLGGLELYADDSSSSSNSSGDAHLTGIREESYVFCSDGSYGYYMEDTTMFSSSDLPSGEFSDFSSEERDQHQGRYEVIAGIMGEPYLLLQASDGQAFLHLVGQSVEGLVINGSSFNITQSSQCQ
jgi:hypothetical protein